jgi:hypothetical protein
MKYPLIEAMGLQITYLKYPCETNIVTADDLEKALQGAPVVYSGKKENPTDQEWDDMKMSNSTHTARVVCIQLLKKQTKAERIAELVGEYSLAGNIIGHIELNEAIERILEMKD